MKQIESVLKFKNFSCLYVCTAHLSVYLYESVCDSKIGGSTYMAMNCNGNCVENRIIVFFYAEIKMA